MIFKNSRIGTQEYKEMKIDQKIISQNHGFRFQKWNKSKSWTNFTVLNVGR